MDYKLETFSLNFSRYTNCDHGSFNVAYFCIAGVVLGCSKHEEVPAGQRLLAEYRVRVWRSRDPLVRY